MNKRKTEITRNYLLHPAGSVLISTGDTKVLCAVTVEEGVPGFLKGSESGWLTAEYSLLPASTNTRSRRDVNRGKVSGRTAEIQRLIGRSLRAVVDFKKFAGYTLTVDCDVLQADGGTRTAAITGACVALHDAFESMKNKEQISENPMQEMVAAISVGIVKGEPMLDLDYINDSVAEVDMNVVMSESGMLVEIQGTAEEKPFSRENLNLLLDLAEAGIKDLVKCQRKALKK